MRFNWLKILICKKEDSSMETVATTKHSDITEFIELNINTWKELIDFFGKFQWSDNYSKKWVFRGESDASRFISPSLERLFENNLESMMQVEELSLRHFKRRYKGEFKPTNSLEWLSLMQHYGTPTRLVDFTYSWYIALFFAIESLSNKNDASLWCINLQELKNGITINGVHTQASHSIIFDAYEKEVCDFIDDHSKGKKVTIPVEPQLLNERIHIQQGLFLINGSWNTKFDDILFQTLQVKKESCQKPLDYITQTKIDEVKVFKLTINKEIKKELIKELFKMNISRETIYPGIEGFAQSIKTRIQAGIYLS